ncbi:MAG: CRISPR-associated helicase/endonuclease Cas3 [Burkholderiales bacterium]
MSENLNITTSPLMFRYWGKADPNYPGTPKWHPLVYHCLDVAAVARTWWDLSPAIRRAFLAAFVQSDSATDQLQAWMLFFVAMHDLGKFDIRFQLKATDALAAVWGRLEKNDHGLALKEIQEFDHGHAGISWARREYANWIVQSDKEQIIWTRWQPWLSAVTGHHGDFHDAAMEGLLLDTDDMLIERDRNARRDFVQALEALFLEPAGLSLQDLPLKGSPYARTLLAGYCAVCDWIGSNVDVFEYRASQNMKLSDYLEERLQKIQSRNIIGHFGLLGHASDYLGVAALLDNSESPRGIQTEIDRLPTTPGLTLIEAPTGSGKTEAALAYAWRLLDAGVADSIVFALPTQATANAMLQRAERFAGRVFGNANVVLAHGRSNLNETFQKLAESGRRVTSQGKTEATVQCAAWLASSRKRVFLGQIGVCTVDQVLLSVLPVRHKFVRGFGLAKSVLIVDEVHAYDAYMHGLLGEVLRQQKASGGSAVLLSATLPANLRAKLLGAWGTSGPDKAPYPVLWHATSGETMPRTVVENQKPTLRDVAVECLKLADVLPDESLIARILAAAEGGALVAIVMNLVDDAQKLARMLRRQSAIEVDLFHARFRFADRREKERDTLAHYGRSAPRQTGRILVATQVIEQSLDLDFDWMVTQICPVDLLFQRLGRLHRHAREVRPSGFESPRCTVLSVAGDDYGAHKLIYGNTRVLWRTEQLLIDSSKIEFPEAYRDWIEQVYQREDWDDEPEKIADDFVVFNSLQISREKDAQRLTTMTVSSFRDEDDRITGLTRDGEMSLSVLPILPDGRLLDGQSLADLPEREQAEAININAVPVPASWNKHLRDCPFEKEGPLAGYSQITLNFAAPGSWSAANGKFHYSQDFGLEKARNESA